MIRLRRQACGDSSAGEGNSRLGRRPNRPPEMTRPCARGAGVGMARSMLAVAFPTSRADHCDLPDGGKTQVSNPSPHLAR